MNQTPQERERNMQNFKAHIEALQRGETPPAIEAPVSEDDGQTE